MNSALTVPVWAISFLSAATSVFVCIERTPIIVCHLAASCATIPTDAPLEVVKPSIFGISPVANICGTAPIFWLRGIDVGVTEWIVCATFSVSVIIDLGLWWPAALVSIGPINGLFGLATLPFAIIGLPETVDTPGVTGTAATDAFSATFW